MRRLHPQFGEWAKGVLERKKLSVRNAALRTGIDRLTLANMLEGVVPRAEIVETFASTFGEDVNDARELAGLPRIEPPNLDAAFEQARDIARRQELTYEPDLEAFGLAGARGLENVAAEDRALLVEFVKWLAKEDRKKQGRE